VDTLLREHLRSEPFPNPGREFIDRRESWNQGNTQACVKRAKIKLFSYALIRNCSYPVGDTRSLRNVGQ
jgi:hypothetical protein